MNKRFGTVAVLAVVTHARGVRHGVGDLVLLVHATQEVRHGALGKDGDVIPGMVLRGRGYRRLW